MSEEVRFQAREIVWAKVGSYPWWPGKIITSLEQQDRNVYKVNFFGDPTYCYLHDEDILPFQARQVPTPGHPNWHSKLKKPLQLAIAALNKSKSASQKCPKTAILPSSPSKQSQHFYEETKIESKDSIEIPQKSAQCVQWACEQNMKDVEEMMDRAVGPDNVISILESRITAKLGKFKGYNQRKRAFDYKSQLEFQLLGKYNLLNIQPLQKPALVAQPRKLHFNRKIKKGSTMTVKAQCVRKMARLLKQKKIERQQVQELALQMVERAEQLSYGEANSFKKMGLALLKWVGNAQSYHISSYNSIFFSHFVTQKKEELQISKLTEPMSTSE